jgi:hypothetical protein
MRAEGFYPEYRETAALSFAAMLKAVFTPPRTVTHPFIASSS